MNESVVPDVSPATLEIVPMGGLGEFGMNMMAVSWQDTTILIDAGVMFPEPDQLGVDLIIPDMTLVEARRTQVKALILTHAFGKITLFFCAGAILVGAHKQSVSEMHGLGRRMPFTFMAFFVGSLSVIGIPPLGGSWSKLLIALGAADAERRIMVGVLMLSTLLSIGYLMPVVARAFFSSPPEDQDGHGHEHATEGLHEAPFLCVLPPVLTAAGCIALFFLVDGVHGLLQGMQLR
jgi:formate hydrogenlyase subunit 3/multisubunit Na+/H+ antiporter MnhD subunit